MLAFQKAEQTGCLHCPDSSQSHSVLYLLQTQCSLQVQIAACDTFRSGAVEQLRTHCNRLNVPLYERGYEKDPAKVAFEAVKVAQRSNIDVVLVDTAGRLLQVTKSTAVAPLGLSLMALCCMSSRLPTSHRHTPVACCHPFKCHGVQCICCIRC